MSGHHERATRRAHYSRRDHEVITRRASGVISVEGPTSQDAQDFGRDLSPIGSVEIGPGGRVIVIPPPSGDLFLAGRTEKGPAAA